MSLIRFSLFRFFLLALLFEVWLVPSFAQASFETPALRLRKFSELKLPPQLDRAEINSLLTTISEQLYDHAFVDMGSMSDVMHAHVVFGPKDASVPPPDGRLTSIASHFDWSTAKLQAFLVHTQEYSFLRPDKTYVGSMGQLDPLARNWIIWPATSERLVTAAHLLAPKYRGERPNTVRVSDLDPTVFGDNPNRWEYSFYFFRVDCRYGDNLTELEFELSSLFEVQVASQRACLNILNFHCRNHPTDEKECGNQPPMESYYTF